MPNIVGVLARVFVDDIDAALELYQSLSGGQEPAHFRFRDVELARVGPFLLLSGNTAAYRNRMATLLVRDLEPVIYDVERTGGHILEGPSPAPNGRRLIARHSDGAIFEYIEGALSPPAEPDLRRSPCRAKNVSLLSIVTHPAKPHRMPIRARF
jgi:predicted enzyme related to lactoylglutathione lyase